MGKGACIKKMIAVRNYSTNTIMEKNTEEEGGRVKDILRGKVKLTHFFGIAHSVLISLGHFKLHFWLWQSQTTKITAV